ncbi:hypothetical protein Sjap_013482 [Stephania japonica]|uniref:Protein kinase domain-containing protein n=1 Tax=Stephania japonica TaxID=461633 RepID=A0AAP0NZY2_9MAGN
MDHYSSPLLLLTLLVLLLTLTTASQRRCPDCGTTLVPYPLSTSPTCDHQSYKIRCDLQSNNTLFFDALNSSYLITSIHPLSQRLVLRPPNFTPNTCTTRTSPPPKASTSTSHSPSTSPVATPSSTSTARALFSVPYSIVAPLVEAERRWPDPGLELEWLLPGEPVCESERDCENDLNSGCGYDPFGQVRRCLCKSGFQWNPVEGIYSNGLTSSLVAALIVVIGALVYKRQKKNREAIERLRREKEEILNSNSNGRSAKVFTGKEIKRVTNNFAKDHLPGSGGYGEVFMGILDDSTVVAVKCAKLGNTRAQTSTSRMALFSITSTAFGPWNHKPLSWRRCLAIAHQTAEGLAYLHSSAVPPIYHKEVKSSNILLDQKLNVKVSDFGLSHLVETDLTHVSTCAQGTLGYLDPEYYRNYQLTDKSDVYSFEVVLLELLTSQKAIEFGRGQDDVNLVVFVQREVDKEALMETIDPMLMDAASKLELETIKALAFLALGCLEERRQN